MIGAFLKRLLKLRARISATCRYSFYIILSAALGVAATGIAATAKGLAALGKGGGAPTGGDANLGGGDTGGGADRSCL